jgi:serine phosphatase RsbU (regulator of sigma subunit)
MEKIVVSSKKLKSMALFAELNPEPVLRFDKNGIILQSNPSANKIFDMKSLSDKNICNLFTGICDINIEKLIKEDNTCTFDEQINEKFFRFIVRGVSELEVCQCYGSDISERLVAQKEAESMALFGKLNPEPVLRCDVTGIILQSNPAANKAFKQESLLNQNIQDIVENFQNIDINNLIIEDKILNFSGHFKDRIFRFMTRGLSKLNVCQIYASDITERVKAEEAVRKQQKDITDSILYASRIQKAVLPDEQLLNAAFEDSFILLKPKDIVSGDFYWLTHIGNQLVIVAADCTGHGVPGAFMSMLGISFLNEIVSANNCCTAAEILNKLRNMVKTTLSSQSGAATSDGMDISLVMINLDTYKTQYAGAYNNLFLIRDKKIITYKADKMPIGKHIKEKGSFTNYILQFKKGDIFYMLSDGYVDQFGEETEKKFTIKKLKELWLQQIEMPMQKQKQFFDDAFENWMGSNKQIDDVLLIGVKV